MDGYATSRRFFPAAAVFRRVQVAGHLRRHRRRDRRLDRPDRVDSLEARPRRGRHTGCRSRSSSSSAARRCCCRTRRSSCGSRRCSTALFGAILAVGKLGFGRDLLAHLMKGVALPGPSGRASRGRGSRSSPSWASPTGTSRSTTPSETWVMFKVWGGIGLFLVFALAQGLWLARHVQEEPHEAAEVASVADVPRDAAGAARAARASGARNPRRQRRARRPCRRRRRRRALFPADRVEAFCRTVPPRSGTSGCCAKSPTSCRTRSTRFRSRR